MAEKEYIERYDEDFLGNKINIGDTVIFEAPGYRSFTIGEVITKAPKSCQIEYINDWNYEGRKEIVRQGYGQIIKHPAADVVEVRHGEWIDTSKYINGLYNPQVNCSVCGHIFWHLSAQTYNYCPACGAKMDGERKEQK